MEDVAEYLVLCDAKVRVAIVWMGADVDDAIHVQIQVIKLGDLPRWAEGEGRHVYTRALAKHDFSYFISTYSTYIKIGHNCVRNIRTCIHTLMTALPIRPFEVHRDIDYCELATAVLTQ